jgi:hypothetical protein
MTFRAGAPLFAAIAILLAHCSAKEIVVAEIAADPTSADGDSDGDDNVCQSNADCTPNEYCAHSCDTGAGHCRKRPLHCDDDGPSVCGCDGITYWSDCVRAEHGVPGSTSGQCRDAGLACDEHQACPSGATCAYLVDADAACATVSVGSCWFPPDTCPTGGNLSWAACSGAARPCVDMCTVLKSGVRYQHLGSSACQ